MNVENRTIFEGDNLHILRGLNSEIIDLIYLDPPFNSNRIYEAPIGSDAAGAAFKDAWTLSDLDNAWHGELAEEQPALYSAISAAGETHGKGMKAYLIMMGIRMLEMQRILKPTGSIYLHCDPTASHYLKTMMDSIFGFENFRNHIVWQRTNSHNDGKQFGRVHDDLLFYSKSDGWVWNPIYLSHNPDYIKKYYRHKDARGNYQAGDLTAAGITVSGESGQQWRGVDPSANGNHWRAPRREAWPEDIEPPENYESLSVHEKLDVLDENGLIYWPPKGNVPRFKRYLSTSKGRRAHDVVTDINPLSGRAKEKIGYPTQKPLMLLKRIIEASSNRGDLVLDPFCGCATTCIAAESLQRQWIGIDISPKAIELLKLRLERDLNLTENTGILGQIIHRTTPPTRSDPTEPRQIHFETLFGVKDKSMLETLSQGELRRFKTHKHVLFGMQEGKCAGCQVSFYFRNMTIDHIKPRSEGGIDHITNLQLLCGACNSTKGNRTQSYLIDKLRTDGILR